MRRILFLAGVLVLGTAATTPAQWLNYKTPGVPRTPDGQAKLDAPAPRTADGRPDLSGVWMHEVTTVAEFKRLFGALIEEAIKVDVPGMEIGTQHKYGLNILLDFKPEDSPMRPETAAAFIKRLSNPRPEDLCDRGGLPAGVPLAGLLSEPIKIVQAPRLTMVMYEFGGAIPIRSTRTAGSCLPITVCRRISATRLDAGSATRSSSRQPASTTRPCSMQWGMRIAISCAWSSAFAAASMDTWTSK